MSQGEKEKLLHLEDTLHESVVGQDEAVRKVAESILRTKAGIAISQSKKSGTKVSEGTGITITLSAGIQEKVTVPSFIGKTKSQITSSCNSIGVKCTFAYESKYSSTPKDTCTKQSTTGKVNKGSTITITLSKGPAKTYSIFIQADWLSQGNP